MALTTRLGWLGAVAYALPILEVWLLTRLSERGASVFLVVLQVAWVVALIVVLDRCIRGSRAFRAAVAEQEAEKAAEAAAEAYRAGARDAAEHPRIARSRAERSSAGRRRSHR